MKGKLLAICLIPAWLLFPRVGVASCAVTPSPAEELKRSAVVFLGKAVKIAPAKVAYARRLAPSGLKWEKAFTETDLVTFEVVDMFKGTSTNMIEIATSTEGDAGYTFGGGTWLREGMTYLVYAYKRRLEGTVDNDWTGYSKGVAAELRRIQRSVPKDLAAEVNEFNSLISPYYASICGRTKSIDQVSDELQQLRNGPAIKP